MIAPVINIIVQIVFEGTDFVIQYTILLLLKTAMHDLVMFTAPYLSPNPCEALKNK
jgi:hypothetical protein